MKPSELAEVLSLGKRAFPNYVMDAKTYELWFQLFCQYSIEQFVTGFFAVIRQSGRTFFPTPGEVMSALKETQDKTAIEYWNDILQSYRLTQEQYLAKHRENSSLKIAIYHVGWKNIFMADTQKELPWLRKEFLATYDYLEGIKETKNNYLISEENAKRILDFINSKTDNVKTLE